MNYEEGSEYSVPDGDGFTGTALTRGASPCHRHPVDLAAESVYKFGSRVGFWRIMDLFAERKLPLTVFACALALERNPEAARATPTRATTCAATDGAGSSTGCSPKTKNANTLQWPSPRSKRRSALARSAGTAATARASIRAGWWLEEGGFLYDGDAYNDELPYWVQVNGRTHLVVPYTNDVNDTKFTHPVNSFATGDDFFTYLRDTFEVLYVKVERVRR